MMKSSRSVWLMIALLSVMVLVGVGVLGGKLRPYWVAGHDGEFADLWGAMLTRARLRGAFLGEAHLDGADLKYTDLRETNLTFASLVGADLTRADLTGGCLWGANLTRANLRRAVLAHADLTQAVLIDADLTGADLNGAIYDPVTRWPAGYDPKTHGAVRVKSRYNRSPAGPPASTRRSTGR